MNWRTPEQAKEEVFIPPFKQYSVVRRARVGDCGESSLLRATGGAMRCFEEALEYAKGQPLSTSTTRAISSPRLSNRKRRECSKRFGKASSRSIVCDICNLLILCMQVRLNRILVSLKAVGHTVNEVVMHYRMQGLRPVSVNTIILAASSLMASPKDQVVSSGSHPAPVAPVSDPVWVCCVRAKPFPRRLNDQGLPDSYGVYRSPWISCSFARHLVIEGY